MAQVELVMPRMGESIMEATILKWLKQEGDVIEEEESVVEIATDKVDSEVPSPVEGTITKILFQEGDVVPVGAVIAMIAVEQEEGAEATPVTAPVEASATKPEPVVLEEVAEGSPQQQLELQLQTGSAELNGSSSTNGLQTLTKPSSGRFYSPLVLNIARQEGISMEALEQLSGSGKNGRVTKKDILRFVAEGGMAQFNVPAPVPTPTVNKIAASASSAPVQKQQPATSKPVKAKSTSTGGSLNGNVEIVEMDRMRRLIADHMVQSKQISPHVTSFVEVDVTNIVNWRKQHKNDFLQRTGEKLTFTPIFIESIAQALKEYPQVNASVDGYKMILKKDINVGMATATPSGNLIVPVIKNADQLNLVGLAKQVNDLAIRARNNKLKPTEIQGGTFTMSNIGSFGSLMGTPIINQPQVAILAIGAIRKKPAVLETEYGDVIAVRQMMMMSLSYDHRIVDGALGSTFLSRIAQLLEGFNVNRAV